MTEIEEAKFLANELDKYDEGALGTLGRGIVRAAGKVQTALTGSTSLTNMASESAQNAANKAATKKQNNIESGNKAAGQDAITDLCKWLNANGKTLLGGGQQ